MTLELDAESVRSVARMAKAVEVALGDVDLSLPQYRLLIYLDRGDEMASALADKLSVSRPSVTALVDGLVERGLVERRPDQDDRRRIGLCLTDQGGRALAGADEVVERRVAAVLGHLPDAEARHAAEGLRLLGRALTVARESRARTG